MRQYINSLHKIDGMRTVMVRVTDKPLKDNIWLRGHNEKANFWKILEFVKSKGAVRAKGLEAEFGSYVYDILEKQVNAGMLDKTQDGYVLSTRFAQILRKFADEWEIFVREGKWDVEGHEII